MCCASSPGSSQFFNVLACEHLNDGRGVGKGYLRVLTLCAYIIILFLFLECPPVALMSQHFYMLW